VQIFEPIRSAVADPTTRFVFPSELSARFWCRRSLHEPGAKTLALDRFLSWDQFKKDCFHFSCPGRPVNRAARLLFVYDLLRQNRRVPRFHRIIPPRYAHEPRVFLEPLERLLPVLHRIPAVRGKWPRFSKDKLRDLEDLYESYRVYLKRCGLYEPAYEKPHFSAAGRSYFLFFPELIEDYGEFAELLHDTIERVAVPQSIRLPAELRVYETLPEEIRAVVCAIAGLLDKGCDPGEIILTVGELNVVEPLLRREADLFGLPLQIHRGKPLNEFPQINLFRKAVAATQSRFDLNGMKDLLLCRAIPWKQDSLCRALIRLGLDGRIAGNSADSDNWLLSIEAAHRHKNPRGLPLSRLTGFYKSLKSRLAQLASAATFAALKNCLVAFSADFLDLKRLDEEELKIYQFAMDTLDELEWASVGSGATERGDEALFSVWWLYLQRRLYVPGRYRPGIAVYPLRVSEGMHPRHHFVINASQAAASHTLRRYPFLKIHEEQSLSGVQRELSAPHLRLYSYSGENVVFSYSRRDFQRSNLPPPVFLTQGIEAQESSPPEAEDPYALERRAWVEDSDFPLQPLQKTGYDSAAGGALESKGIDAARQLLKDGRLIRSLQERLLGEDGLYRISATTLELYNRCPFDFLFERLLEVSAEEHEPAMIDPLELGRLLHRAMERFFTGLLGDDAAQAPMLHAAERSRYRKRLEKIVAEICSDYVRGNPALLVPIAVEIRRRVEEMVFDFLDVELRTMSEERFEGSELRLDAQAPELKTVMLGYIDRINRNADGYTLIDYKKKSVPTRGQIFSEPPESMQMPFYMHLMERNGMSVTRAAYYSFEKRRYHFVFGAAKANMGTEEQIRTSAGQIEGRIAAMLDRMADGDYRVEAGGKAQCSRCLLAEICRRGYSLGG